MSAENLFAAERAKRIAQDVVETALEKAGVFKDGEWEDWWFDDYDASIEISGFPKGRVLTKDEQAAIWALGFDRCWVHACPRGEQTRKTETYYSKTV